MECFIFLHICRKDLCNILRRKACWIGHILRRNCLLHDAIEGLMTEVKGVGRRRTQLLDGVRNRTRCWELKKEAADRKKSGSKSLSVHHKEEIQVIFHKFISPS